MQRSTAYWIFRKHCRNARVLEYSCDLAQLMELIHNFHDMQSHVWLVPPGQYLDGETRCLIANGRGGQTVAMLYSVNKDESCVVQIAIKAGHVPVRLVCADWRPTSYRRYNEAHRPIPYCVAVNPWGISWVKLVAPHGSYRGTNKTLKYVIAAIGVLAAVMVLGLLIV